MTEKEGLLRIGLAAIFGAVVGFDREAHAGSAGLRTHVLVALGAATFTVLGIQVADSEIFQAENIMLDPTRILEGIITGIGFLGGAIVFRDGDRARNVTTAAGIWAVTGLGIAFGLGLYLLATGITALIFTVLSLLKMLQHRTNTR